MRHLDLFSGIGGFALAARWVGWETVAFCEIDPYCKEILKKNWPKVPIYEDVKTVVADPQSDRRRQRWARGIVAASKDGKSTKTTTVGPIDIITAGFPCQDISVAGKGEGIEGERSGLWTELARVIGKIRPRYAVLENVSNLLSGDRGRWFQRVLGDLAEIGYDCEWHCIPASAIGAPHRRDRVWIICYPAGARGGCSESGEPRFLLGGDILASCGRNKEADAPDRSSKDVANSNTKGLQERQIVAGMAGIQNGRNQGEDPSLCGWWDTEPNVGRVANGIPNRVDRLRGLGNAIVPQVAEIIFRAIDDAT